MSVHAAAIYLDHAATTPLARGVRDEMLRVLDTVTANPSSPHADGQAAAHEIEIAAATVADLVGAKPPEIVWTSGATESINLALKGVAEFAGADAHIVSVVTEHDATRDSLAWLERRGATVTRLGVDRDGRIDLAELRAALACPVSLVSIMHVNNETGVIQDLHAIGAVCQTANVPLHVDAAQSLGRLPIDVTAMNIALLSMSAHKIGGPKGIGALYVRRRPRLGLSAQMLGGGQQGGRRSGTLATHQIAGFAAAARSIVNSRDEEQIRQAGLRDRLWEIVSDIYGVTRNGCPTQVAAAFLSVSVDDVHGAALLAGLMHGTPALAVSTGAACSAAKSPASHVLRAMGHDARRASATLRFSLGSRTTPGDIETAGARVVAEIIRLRALADVA